MAKSEWVKVRSEDELRPGMTVEVRPCLWCRRTERLILFRRQGVTPFGQLHTGEIVTAPRESYGTSQTCTDHDGIRFRLTISDGRLYRLHDLDEADETTEDARTKERVR